MSIALDTKQCEAVEVFVYSELLPKKNLFTGHLFARKFMIYFETHTSLKLLGFCSRAKINTFNLFCMRCSIILRVPCTFYSTKKEHLK